jgi:hypothetical protein
MFALVALFLAAAPAMSDALQQAQLTAAEIGPECIAAKQPGAGSLATLIESTVFAMSKLKPKGGRAEQDFACSAAGALIYWFDCDTATAAKSYALSAEKDLWGKSNPLVDYGDRVMTNRTVLAILSGEASQILARKLEAKGFEEFRVPWPSSPTAASGSKNRAILKTLASELDCRPTSEDPFRAWCPAALTGSAGFSMPDRPETLLGITAGVRSLQGFRHDLVRFKVSTLSVGAGKLMVRSLEPTTDDERKQAAAIGKQVLDILRGEQSGAPIRVVRDLVGFLKAVNRALASEGYAVNANPKAGARFVSQIPSVVYLVHVPKVGDVYVVVEEADNGGTFVNLFPVVDFAAE